MSNYQAIPIIECHDPLIAIPPQAFAFSQPHPYHQLGAPYSTSSPWMLRQRVVDALLQAQQTLQMECPAWHFKLFDAYRPVAVQAFMVWREFQIQAERLADLPKQSLMAYRDHIDLQNQHPLLYARLATKVFEFWSIPSDDPHTPPPHSTGAAIDLTLQDTAGHEINMGCPIDETTERAYPDYYAQAESPIQQTYHAHRILLNKAMTSAGFTRHAKEWWHFSFGDQMWAWTRGESTAIYGRIDDA